MIGRRPLAELLGELADGIGTMASGIAETPVGVRSLSVSLPIDIRLDLRGQAPMLVGDVPLFRTRTDFDAAPARLEVEWHVVPAVPEDAQ